MRQSWMEEQPLLLLIFSISEVALEGVALMKSIMTSMRHTSFGFPHLFHLHNQPQPCFFLSTDFAYNYIVAEFVLDKDALKRICESNEEFRSSNSGGAAHRGAIGPFGLLVLADKSLIGHILSMGFKNHYSLLLNPSDQVSVRTKSQRLELPSRRLVARQWSSAAIMG
ncbi:hypothetical protein Q3G72_002466 [Acer saccharum]|nr:hypothetical protein Q3G72_002466 [Acer saccharum]